MYDWFIRDTLYFSMHCCFITNIPYLIIMYIRYDQYWQIAYQKFLVEHNCIKMVSWNISIFWRKLLQFWGKFLSTSLFNLMDTFYVKYCIHTNAVLENFPQNRDYFQINNIFLYPFFYTILCDQKLLIRISFKQGQKVVHKNVS